VEVWIDGNRAGVGRIQKVVRRGRRSVEIREGNRVLIRKVVEVPGGGKASWSPRVAPPRQPPRRPPDRPPPRRAVTPPRQPTDTGRRARVHWAWFVATSSLAVGLAGAAIGLGVHSLQLREDLRDDPADDALRQQTKDAMVVTNVLWGAAGAAAIAAGILVIFTRWRARERRGAGWQIRPSLGPGLVGLALHGEL
jgi:hypothetical protein